MICPDSGEQIFTYRDDEKLRHEGGYSIPIKNEHIEYVSAVLPSEATVPHPSYTA